MNLWADIEHSNQPPPGTGNRAFQKGRLSERGVLSSLRDWLLHDYVASYSRSLASTRIYRRCYWIDALGTQLEKKRKQDGEAEVKKGSKQKKVPSSIPQALQPIAELSRCLAQQERPITLFGLLLASGSSRRNERSAAKSIKQLALPKENAILPASWLEAAPLVLKETEQSPAIFLLNPFGATLFSHEEISQLYQRKVPTELCFLIPHKQLIAHLNAARRSSTTAAVLTGLLRTDRWKTLSTKVEDQDMVTGELLNLFISSAQRYFQLPLQQIALPSLVPLPYSLIFATRRQDSLLSMNDAVCVYQRRVAEQGQRGTLAEEWFATQRQLRQQEALQQLYQQVLQTGRAQRVRRWPDLRQQLLLARFGDFTTSEYDKIIQELLLKQELRCEWKRRTADPEELRPPGPEDTLFWT